MRRQFDVKILPWCIAFGTLTSVLFGCAGNNTGGSTAGSTAGTTAGSTTGGLFPEVAKQNLTDAPSLFQYAFLTGAGRAPDIEKATIRRMQVSDTNGTEATDLSERVLTLTSPQSQMLSTNVPLNGLQSRQFGTLILNVVSYQSTDDLGSQSFTSITGLPAGISSDIRAYGGRSVHVPIYADPATINVVTGTGGGPEASFDDVWFDQINRLDGDTVTIRSFLSDYVGFNISTMPIGDRPVLSQGNGAANRVFFSGDQYAMGAGDPTNGGATGAPFETIYPSGQEGSIVGRYSAPFTIPGGAGGGSVTPGSYTTLGADPNDVSTTDPVLVRKITSFQSTWKDHFKQVVTSSGGISDIGYFKSVHSFEALSFPSSKEDSRQDVVFVSQSIIANGDGTRSAQVNNLFWGYMDLDTNELFLYPIKNLGDSDAVANRVGEIRGTIGARFTRTGSSTSAPGSTAFVDFTLTGTVPSGMSATGKIVVLRL